MSNLCYLCTGKFGKWMNKIKFWFRNARPTSLPQSVMPSVLAVFLALGSDDFSIALALVAVAGVVAAHLAFNLFDDYFDYIRKPAGYRVELKHEGFRARVSKCTYLTSGAATVRELLAVCILMLLLAAGIGVLVFAYRGMPVLYIAIMAAALSFFYSAPPLRLSYHGLGELVIGIVFGPLNMAGTYYAACGHMDWEILLVSVPVGLLVMNIVYVHSILDFIPDKKAGKMTLAVLLDNRKAMLAVEGAIVFLPYVSVVCGMIAGYLTPWYCLVFLTLPMAISLFYMMQQYVADPDRVFEPKPWMGPLNGWDWITAAGIEWFMIRWLTARNLLAFFCLTIMVICVLGVLPAL